MVKYRKDFQIPYYEADKNGKATPLSMLNYLGETSGAHTDSLGLNVEKLKKINCGWMLNRWKVRIDRYPNVKEKITIETWSSGMDRFYATREFIIYDEDDLEIGRASTLWIFIDMTKKRPIRIPADFIETIKPIEVRTFYEFYDFNKEISMKNYIDFHVRRSDIDYNNHVNNAKYLSWMIETIPEYVFENYMLHEFEIIYKKETTYGNTIMAGSDELDKSEDEFSIIHTIMDDEIKETHSMGMTKWNKIKK